MYWIGSEFKLPLMLVRYEDLMEQPELLLKHIMMFVLDVDPDDIKGSRLEQNIKRAVEEKPQQYMPRRAEIDKSF